MKDSITYNTPRQPLTRTITGVSAAVAYVKSANPELQLVSLMKRIEQNWQVPTEEDLNSLNGYYREGIDSLVEGLKQDGEPGYFQAKTLLLNKHSHLLQYFSTEQKQRRIRFVSDVEFENMPTRQWDIQGIIPTQSTVILYGPPACLKTFLAMSWAFSLGTGRDWLGHKVSKCPVAYIVAEGGYGVGSRIKALKKEHNYTGESGIKWYPDSLTIQNEAVMSELIEALREDFSEVPGILFIDTLHKCSVGADENSNNDMGNVLKAADTICKELHCTVVIIHHTGKNGELRGASCLTGDIEKQIKVMPTDSGCVITSEKTKDAADFSPIYLEKKVVKFGTAEDENSLILIASDKPSKLALSKSEQAMYAAIIDKELTHSDWVNVNFEIKLLVFWSFLC